MNPLLSWDSCSPAVNTNVFRHSRQMSVVSMKTGMDSLLGRARTSLRGRRRRLAALRELLLVRVRPAGVPVVQRVAEDPEVGRLRVVADAVDPGRPLADRQIHATSKSRV